MTTGAEWIERYVNAVGRQLPPKERADVELELRFLIQDELDPGDFQFADEAQVLAVLARFGRPETVAARYRAPRYLIGPRLFPVFRSVLGIVVAVSLALSLFGAIVTANVTQAQLNLLDAVGHIWAGLLQEVAIVVLVFAVIEAFARGEQRSREKPWNPRTLPPVKDPDLARPGAMTVDIGFTVAAILIFNFFMDWLSIYSFADGHWDRTPLITPAFLHFVPWLTAIWILEATLKTFVLMRGHWTYVTRWLELLLSVGSIGVLVWMLSSGSLAATPTLEPAFRLVLALVLAITTIDTAVQFFRLAGRYWSGAANRPTSRAHA